MSETSGPTLRVRLDLAYDGTAFSGGPPSPALRTVAGRAGGGPDHGAAQSRARPRSRWPDAPTPACTRAARSSTSTSTRRRGPPCRGARTGRRGRPRLAASAASCPPTSSCAARAAAPGRLRRALRRPRAALPLPHRRPGRRRDPLRRHDTVWWRRPLDVAAMDEAARSLVGLRDFAAFCKQREGATTMRTLLDFSWSRLRRRGARRHGARRRLLPLDGALPRRRRRARWARAGAPSDWPRALQDRAVRARRDPRHAAARPQPRGGRLPGDDSDRLAGRRDVCRPARARRAARLWLDRPHDADRSCL